MVPVPGVADDSSAGGDDDSEGTNFFNTQEFDDCSEEDFDPDLSLQFHDATSHDVLMAQAQKRVTWPEGVKHVERHTRKPIVKRSSNFVDPVKWPGKPKA